MPEVHDTEEARSFSTLPLSKDGRVVLVAASELEFSHWMDGFYVLKKYPVRFPWRL